MRSVSIARLQFVTGEAPRVSDRQLHDSSEYWLRNDRRCSEDDQSAAPAEVAMIESWVGFVTGIAIAYS